MSEAEIQRLAVRAILANKGVPGNYIRRSELVCRITGFRCEERFALMYRLPYDAEARAAKGGSDGGYDFKVFFNGFPLTFDIKGRDSDKWDDLLVQPNKFDPSRRIADYFVAARCWNREVEWLGWIDCWYVRAMPIDQALPEPAHVVPRARLRPMDELNHLMILHDDFARPA